MSVSIKYKGTEIASASTEVTKTIKTAGKYCEADILVENTPDGGDAPVINPLSVTANGTYTAPSGVDGYSPVTVNVPAPTPTLQDKTITTNGTYSADEGYDGLGEVVVNVSGGSGDITTPWFSVKTTEVVIGANSVNNPQTAVSYFEGIVGENKYISAFLKSEKSTYGADELVSLGNVGKHTDNLNALPALVYRMRNNQINNFAATSGYSCYLYEGATYAVLYYENRP